MFRPQQLQQQQFRQPQQFFPQQQQQQQQQRPVQFQQQTRPVNQQQFANPRPVQQQQQQFAPQAPRPAAPPVQQFAQQAPRPAAPQPQQVSHNVIKIIQVSSSCGWNYLNQKILSLFWAANIKKNEFWFPNAKFVLAQKREFRAHHRESLKKRESFSFT